MENNICLQTGRNNSAPCEIKKYMPTEEQIQAACFIWFWNTYPTHRRMLFHADNNSANKYVGNKKKSLGVVKGVSDFILVCDNGVVWFLEMKTLTGTQKTEQKEFMEQVTIRGHYYRIIRSLEQFKEFIWEIIGK